MVYESSQFNWIDSHEGLQLEKLVFESFDQLIYLMYLVVVNLF